MRGGLMVEHARVQPYVAGIEGGMDSVMGLRKQSVVDLLIDLLDTVTGAESE